MSAVATAIVGGAIIGGVVANNAAGKAADAQTHAADQANATQLEMFNQNREDAAPYREAGYTALKQLGTGTAPGGDFNRDFTMADFVKDPGYQFRMDQGQRALDAGASARGGVLSGATIKATERYGQDYASGEFTNAYNRFNNDRTLRFNRLSSVAGTGQTAVTNVSNLGQRTADNISENTLQAGNARASGYVAQGNSINNGLQTLGNYYLQRQYAPAAVATPQGMNLSNGGTWA